MNYSVGGTWAAMSALTAIPIGTPVSIRNIGRAGDIIEVIVSETEPLESDRGEVITQLGNTYRISGQPSEVWLRYISYSSASTLISSLKTCLVSIDAGSYLSVDGLIPSDIHTSNAAGVRRIAVDDQHTSFADNRQFRFFDRFDSVSTSSQIVYKISTSNKINIMNAVVCLHSGGRQIAIYEGSESVTFTGTLSSTGRSSFVNNNLNPSILSHPATGVVVERAIGSGIFSSIDLPIFGDSVISSSQGNSSSSSVAQGEIRDGVPAMAFFWYVLDAVGNNDDASGGMILEYEELF